MDAHRVPLIPVTIQGVMMDMPEGMYGISYYDIFTRKTEDNLSHTATYAELSQHFDHIQYSNWYLSDTNAMNAYWSMLSLVWIQPLGKLQSTIKGLKMHQTNDEFFDVTNNIQLGDLYSTTLQGLTSARLILVHVAAAMPQAGQFHLPVHTKQCLAASCQQN
ncbi:hypothetical protein L210DRAFT_870531 [Boletus edulis BED1]|uniref:Uncharacterized protein n=1 Tax=Boletus edulis BED1 TaxID=1328754 RepID=A0AAD4BVL8_BOLED|nr:hypothetical protein L210DRAFT_870531 [Boletus edulis BED1]